MRYDVRIRGEELDITWCSNADAIRANQAVEDLLLREMDGVEILITPTSVQQATEEVSVRSGTPLTQHEARLWIEEWRRNR